MDIDEMKDRIARAEEIQRYTENRCEALEEENKTVTRKMNEAIADKLLITAKYNEVLNELNQKNDKLQKENAELRNNGFTVSAMTEQQLKVALKKGEQLEKENAELKCECRRCVYTDSPCILSDYGKDRNGICDHFKDVFDENAELRTKLEALEGQTPWKDIKDKSELIKENAELKEKNKWYSEQVCNKECAEVWGNLTNAKEIIKKLKALYFSPVVTKDDVKRQDEILAEVEQFLKECK